MLMVPKQSKGSVKQQVNNGSKNRNGSTGPDLNGRLLKSHVSLYVCVCLCVWGCGGGSSSHPLQSGGLVQLCLWRHGMFLGFWSPVPLDRVLMAGVVGGGVDTHAD